MLLIFFIILGVALVGFGIALVSFYAETRFVSFLLSLIYNIAILAAILFFPIIIGWSLVDQLTFIQRAPTSIVQGKITSITIEAPGTEDASCQAHIQFVAHDEQRIEIINPLSDTTKMGETYCDGRVGDSMKVAYHIADPHDARVIPPRGFLLGNLGVIVAFIFVSLGSGFLALRSLQSVWFEHL